MVECDFAEVCCTSDSLLSRAVTSIGGRAVQYSHWNGFDLTTKAGTDKLKEDLLEKKPRVVWMTPPCTTQRSQKIKVSSNTDEHPGCVSLACEATLVRSDSGSDVRGGALSTLCSRRCLHNHPHQTVEKETLQYTQQLVKTVAKEIMKVESSGQIHSQTCM